MTCEKTQLLEMRNYPLKFELQALRTNLQKFEGFLELDYSFILMDLTTHSLKIRRKVKIEREPTLYTNFMIRNVNVSKVMNFADMLDPQ